MNQLIKVNFDSDRPTTSARDLWEALGKPHSEFMKWFSRYSEYGFTENTDYKLIDRLVENPQGGRPATDYEVTINMAKELSMLQKNERGKQIRLYLIEVEEQWNDPEILMARAIKMADKKILILETKIKQLQPLVDFAQTCAASQDSLLVRELAKLMSKQGINTGEHRLYRILRAWKLIFPNSTEPYQEYIDRGYFEVIQVAKQIAGDTRLFKTTRVTPKGQIYIINRLKKELALPATGTC